MDPIRNNLVGIIPLQIKYLTHWRVIYKNKPQSLIAKIIKEYSHQKICHGEGAAELVTTFHVELCL